MAKNLKTSTAAESLFIGAGETKKATGGTTPKHYSPWKSRPDGENRSRRVQLRMKESVVDMLLEMAIKTPTSMTALVERLVKEEYSRRTAESKQDKK